jgi:hypothetical protein
MSQVRRTLQILLMLLLLFALVPSLPAQSNTMDITWYTGGEGRLTLDPVAADGSAIVPLAGSTSQRTLMVKVAKKGGSARSNPIPLAADGTFSVRYLIKDGVGSYTITFFGSDTASSLKFQGLGFFTLAVHKALPANVPGLELNSRIIEYVNKVMGSTVGSGECWDLAQEALDTNLADWTRPLNFGLSLNPETDEIKAGDIIQFREVVIVEHLPGGVTRRETIGAPDHTAIIYKVLGKKQYILAHQNVAGNRTVITGEFNLAHATRGKYWIYRPVALMLQQEQ